MRKREYSKIDILLRVTFVFYIVFLLKMIVFKYVSPFELFDSSRDMYRSVNLVPFKNAFSSKFIMEDTIGNIIAFLPLGVYYKMFNRDNNFKIFIKGFLLFLTTSIVFEGSQYVFGIGASDVTDVITNTTGGVIGMLGLTLVDKLFKNTRKVDKIIAILSTIVMIILSVLIVLLYLVNG